MMGLQRTLAVSLGAALAACSVAATPSFAAPPEFSPPFPNPFKAVSRGMTLETIGGFKVTCTADTSNGEVTGPSTAALTITFTGCARGEGPDGGSCQNASGGEIITEPLFGTLGYLNRKHTAVGLDLSNPSASPTGGALIKFFCGEDTSVEVVGSLIGRVAPINKVVEPGGHMTLKFAQKGGHQAIKKLLGGSRDVPMTRVLFGPLEESGIASTGLLSFASPIEIIA
jgi:hypothetical protein